MQRVNQEAVTTQVVLIDAKDCPNCGVIYGLTQEYINKRREDCQTFYCPNGHSIWYGDGDVERARKKAKWLGDELAELHAQHDQVVNDLLDKTKEVKSLRQHGKAGLCAFCRRSFVNLKRHVDRKHPEA